MSTLAAGVCTRGISTVCWQPALSLPVHLENAPNAHKAFFSFYFFCRVLSQSEKTFLPSVGFLNGKLFACDARSSSCMAQCLVSPRTGLLHWGSRVAAAKTDGCPSKSCLWLSVRCKGGAKSDQRRRAVDAHCWLVLRCGAVKVKRKESEVIFLRAGISCLMMLNLQTLRKLLDNMKFHE